MVEIETLEKNLAEAPQFWNETPSWSNLRDVLKELREASKLYNEQKEQDEKLKQDEALLEEWTRVPIYQPSDNFLSDPTMGMPELHLNSPIIHCILSDWEKFPKKLIDALKADLEIALKDVILKLTALGFKVNMAEFEGRKAKDKRLTKRGSMWVNVEHPLIEIQREISDQTKNGLALTADALNKYIKEINGLFIEVQREATHVTSENLLEVQEQLKNDDWEEDCDHEMAEDEYDYPTLGDPIELGELGALGDLGELNEFNAIDLNSDDKAVPALRFSARTESPFSLSPISLSPQVSGEKNEKDNTNKERTLIF